jgi:hypothetical protein
VIELDGSQINLFGEQQENALKLLRRQGIKLEDPSAVNSFIFLNERLFAPPGDQGPLKRLSSSVHTIFHEIGHSFSSLAGAKKEDYKLVNNLQKLTTQDPSLSYESITQKAIGSLQYHALEEARADSVGYALASRTSLKEYLSERLSLGGYAKLGGGFKSGYYNPRYKEKVSELMQEVSSRDIASGIPEDIADDLLTANMKKAERLALIEAHATYHSTLSVPSIFSGKLQIEQMGLIDESIEAIQKSADPSLVSTYKTAMLEAASGTSASLSISPALASDLKNINTVADSSQFKSAANYLRSSSLSTMDRTSELIAQASLSSESILPEIAQDSAQAARAVVSSTVDNALSTVDAPILRAASKTSSRIIKRNGNCF